MAADAVTPGNVRATDRLSLVASVVGICRRVFGRRRLFARVRHWSIHRSVLRTAICPEAISVRNRTVVDFGAVWVLMRPVNPHACVGRQRRHAHA
jgi:hypothetical protein